MRIVVADLICCTLVIPLTSVNGRIYPDFDCTQTLLGRALLTFMSTVYLEFNARWRNRADGKPMYIVEREQTPSRTTHVKLCRWQHQQSS